MTQIQCLTIMIANTFVAFSVKKKQELKTIFFSKQMCVDSLKANMKLDASVNICTKIVSVSSIEYM